MPDTTCLKWPGGKGYLARKIVALMPRHLNYVEPYFGGGSVLFARDPLDQALWLPPHSGVSEVVNDLNEGLTNFWRVIREPVLFEQFCRAVSGTEFSEALYHHARGSLLSGPDYFTDRVRRAWAFFVLNRQSLAGRMKGFTGITKTRTRRAMNNEVSAWLSAVEKLPEFHERLKRVFILNRPALHVIEEMDVPETFFYLDPPYLHETRVTTHEYGRYEMSCEDHTALMEKLTGLNGKFLLSGYRSDLYDRFAEINHWDRVDIEIVNQASHKTTKDVKVECLWRNYC